MKPYVELSDSASNYPVIVEAVKKCNEHMNSHRFHRLLQERKENFLHSNVNGIQLSRIIKDSHLRLTVDTYRSKWPWSKANGYYTKKYPSKLFLNTRRLNRTLGSIGATAGHEWVHGEDDRQENFFFHHESNTWTPEKEDTAPFYVDNLLEQLIDNKLPEEVNKSESVKIKNRSFVWWNPFTWF